MATHLHPRARGQDGNVTLVIATGGVTRNMIANNAVTTEKIANGTIRSEDLSNGTALAEIKDNDGSGSGLDADLLDGKHASNFAVSSHNHDSRYAKSKQSCAIGNVVTGIDSGGNLICNSTSTTAALEARIARLESLLNGVERSGNDIILGNLFSSVSGGGGNTANGTVSSISKGACRSASGFFQWVAGGLSLSG